MGADASTADRFGRRPGEHNFTVMLGALRELLANKRQVLGHLALASHDRAGLPIYTEQMERLAWRIALCEAMAGLFERFVPHEAMLRALAERDLLPSVAGFEAPRPGEYFPAGSEVLGRDAVEEDCGDYVNVIVSEPNGYRRASRLRKDILGIRRPLA